MPHLKKSQAALEFIMTYGWAIMAVLVAIGSLAYFGVLSPGNFLPSKCQLQPGLACIDHKAHDIFGFGNGYVAVSVQNSLGYDMNNVKIAVTGCKDGTTEGTIKNGDPATVLSGTGCTFTNKKKFSGDINITYQNSLTLINHTATGTIRTRVDDSPLS